MRVPGGAGTRIVTFISDIWSGAPTRLQQGAAAQYQKLARSGDFGPWWLNACGGEQPGVRRFRVQMPSTEWERPWEAIVAALDPSRWGDVSIIRQIEGDEAPRHPSSLSEALSVLVLQGAPSGPNLDMLDLDAEFQLIAKAYQERDFTVQQAVSAPIPERTSFAELDSLLLKHRPSVLWFSGHARPSPPGLLLNDGHWLTPDELAGSIQRTTVQHGRTPIYAVLWACNTGSAARFAVSMAAPPFIDVLFDQGISALLAAQAPLSEAAARRVAAHVFAALASGHPLDHGVARARGDLMRVSGARLLEDIDWVCPVVWSKEMCIRDSAMDGLRMMPTEIKQRLCSRREAMREYLLLWADCFDYDIGFQGSRAIAAAGSFLGEMIESTERELNSTITDLCQQRPNSKAIHSARDATERALKACLLYTSRDPWKSTFKEGLKEN